MKDYGLVSIITPLYNRARFIAESIESVLRQSYPNWELLIQDDGSSDGGYEIAQRYAMKDARIKVQKNGIHSGAATSRNNAIRRAEGEWIAFLDSDDIWLPDKLERQLDFMVKNNVDFSFTEYEQINQEGEPRFVKAKALESLTYKKMLYHNWTGCLTVMYRQDPEHKIYGPDVKCNNDWALFLKVLKTGVKAKGMHEITALYRTGHQSLSTSKLGKVKPWLTILTKHEGVNSVRSLFNLSVNLSIKYLYKYRRIGDSVTGQSKHRKK